jgi:hypothetical protein
MSGMTISKQVSHDKHEFHPNTYSEEATAGVHEDITSIPHYHSHYFRAQNPIVYILIWNCIYSIQ